MRQVIQTTVAFRDYRTYHAFGQWFRFFLPWVIPVHVTHTIYVDPDVWFVSSIAALWGERDPGAMLQVRPTHSKRKRRRRGGACISIAPH